MNRRVVSGRTKKTAKVAGSSTATPSKEQDAATTPDARPPDRTNEPRAGETFESEFLDNVAHQMIAPLQSIERHCVNMLLDRVPESKRKQRLGEVIGHVKVLAELAQRMRFLHELVSGAEIQGERVPFESVVTIWIDGFNNYMPQGMLANIDTNTMNKLPDVVASSIAVRQVVMNLYDNAMKYGKPDTPVVVTARLEPPFVVNEFSHAAGIALSTDAARQVFERGYRAPEAKALRGSGTGVGMWITRELMRAMKGDIRAIPTNDGVTRFILSWRLA